MTVGELLTSMSSKELAEWIAFYRIEPFGEVRGDLQAGIIASVIAEGNRDSKKRPKPYTPLDFIPDFANEFAQVAETKKAQTPEEQIAIVELLNRRFGGKDLREKR